MIKQYILFFFLLISQFAFSQQNLSYYLPQEISYNPEIPKPRDIIGHQVGEWHVSHDRLVSYMYALAESSDRMQIEETGRTYENRPLLILTVSSPDNLSHLEEIRSQHLKLSDPQANVSDLSGMPAVLYMGYSIHGNEASGSNAALLFAYYLAAAQGPEIENTLQNTVILLDPSFNPDGLNRFSSWVNSRKSQQVSADPNDMEHNEYWPGGRTNHYWFDLNRDWLPAQLPESQARLKVYHRWKPNLLTDHHEMGTNGTFFFQPGIPSRNNPLTPEDTYRLTREIGKYHAQGLDEIGSLYYSNESYDDYYLGKGSSYPDVNGAVGILFEQASSRGHAQESDNGILTFPFTIRNHLTVSLSTLKAAVALREQLLKHEQEFFHSSVTEAKKAPEPAYIIGSKDHMRLFRFGQLVSRHDIQIDQVTDAGRINGTEYQAGEMLSIPLEQPQFRLIKAMFEQRTDFQDSLFYDVSTWTLPLAFGLDFKDGTIATGESFNPQKQPTGKVVNGQATYAYAFEWNEYLAPRLLYQLQNHTLRVRLANEPFNLGGHSFGRGSMVVPLEGQPLSADSIYQLMDSYSRENGVDVYGLNSGLDYSTYSLGSPSFTVLEKPVIAMLVEGRVRSYNAGEIWHFLDQTMDMPVTLMPMDVFNRTNLDQYTVLILPDGRYSDISESGRENLKSWVRNGGTLIAFGDALPYLTSAGLSGFTFKKEESKALSSPRPYNEYRNARGAQELGGAIFSVKIDRTNPLFYGYASDLLPVFKNDRQFLNPSDNRYGNPMRYTSSPLLSGYISAPNLKLITGSSAAGISSFGSGKVIGFTNDLVFRAFWYGTSKVFMNAVFLGNTIGSGANY